MLIDFFFFFLSFQSKWAKGHLPFLLLPSSGHLVAKVLFVPDDQVCEEAALFALQTVLWKGKLSVSTSKKKMCL